MSIFTLFFFSILLCFFSSCQNIEKRNQYVFHRVTESKSSGGKKNWKLKSNPIEGCKFTCYTVKKEQIDKKNRFSPFEIDLKKDADVQYPWIKRANK